MDINWLRDFVCLGRTLNFTRAADERNITQSAFSRRIKSLESWIGVPLVDRANFPIRLSHAGEQFLPVAKEAIVRLSEARQSIRDQDQGNIKFVRFAVLHTISVHYLAPRIEELEQSIQDLRIRVISDSLSTCCQLLDEAACEFLLCYRHAEVNPVLDEANFARKDILIDQLVPVAEKNTAILNKWTLPGQRSKNVPYLAYESSSFLGEVVEHIIGKKSAHLDIRYMDGLVEALKRRLITGGGIAWMPYSAIKTELEDGQLITVGDEKWETPLILSLYCAPDKIDTIAKEVWKQF
ncbi:LysR family transcriptional regulator [Kiloniella majae]|uniref:LysR family transcriptional regulator n=1 Tax=Kiloniella majae TaxID=1938558 RepID=UPI000A278193|nr:LysR family transcriptional regulator [Kiloniella majae]